MFVERNSASREIRLFLSSTFKDMEHERQHLMTQVFPIFRQRCMQRQVVFTEIDLRWGITPQAAQNGRTVEICLEEIQRCRDLGLPPFFIGFLGERYGWVPTRDDLKAYWDQHPDSPYADQIARALDRGMSVTELEMRFGFLDTPPQQADSRVLMLLRDPALTEQLSSPGLADPQDERLDALKDAVRQAHARGETVLVDAYTSVAAFGQAVLNFLDHQLDTLYPLDQVPDLHEQQGQQHHAWACSRLQAYVPDTVFNDAILSRLQDADDSRPVMLQGASGSGKSALLADIARQLHDGGHAWVFAHFCAVDGYAGVASWRDRLWRELLAQGLVAQAPPDGEQARWAALTPCLAQASARLGRPMVLILDAIDQLGDAGLALSRLPAVLPDTGVRLLGSVTTSVQPGAAWTVIPMSTLDASRRRHIVTQYLGHFGKAVPDAVVQDIALAPQCDSLLFLRIILDEARLHARHETLVEDVQRMLDHGDASTLFQAALATADADFDFHAPGLATQAVRLMAASRRGLTHHEIAALLGQDGARVPDHVLLPLLANLQAYCQQAEGRIALTHAILVEGLEQDRARSREARLRLMAYYQGSDPDAITEYAYQMLRLQMSQTEGVVQDTWAGKPTGPGGHAPATLADLMRYDTETNLALTESLRDMRRFIAVWQTDRNVIVNFLPWIGAGKAWQSTVFQDLLVQWWFESIADLDPDDVRRLPLDALGNWLQLQPYYTLARSFMTQLFALKLRILDDDPEQLALTAGSLGKMQMHNGEQASAQALLEQALAWWAACGKSDDEDALSCLPHLSPVYYASGRDRELHGMLVRALTTQQEAGVATTESGRMWSAMTWLAVQRDDRERARTLADTGLQVRRMLYGPVHREVSKALAMAAEVFVAQDDLPRALQYMRESVDMARATLTESHPELADALKRLAEFEHDAGNLIQATALCEEAVTSFKHHLPTGNRRNLWALGYLSELYLALDDKDMARQALEDLIKQSGGFVIEPQDALVRQIVSELLAQRGQHDMAQWVLHVPVSPLSLAPQEDIESHADWARTTLAELDGAR